MGFEKYGWITKGNLISNVKNWHNKLSYEGASGVLCGNSSYSCRALASLTQITSFVEAQDNLIK